MLQLLESRQLYANTEVLSACHFNISEWELCVIHNDKSYDVCGAEFLLAANATTFLSQEYFEEEDMDWAFYVPHVRDVELETPSENIKKFLIAESRDDFSLEGMTGDVLSHSFKYNHLSNFLGLLRWSAQHGMDLKYLNAFLLLEIAGLYLESYTHQQADLRPLKEFTSSIDEVYDENLIKKSGDAYLLNQATIAIVGLEALGLVACNSLGVPTHHMPWASITIPLMQIGIGSIQIYQGMEAIDQYALRSKLALPFAEVLAEYGLEDQEFTAIGEFIQDAQDVYEGMFLVSCDVLKFMGNAFGLAVAVMTTGSVMAIESSPFTRYTHYLSNSLLITGSLGYAGYGMWQVAEWFYEKKSAFGARFDAMASVIQGDKDQAQNHLLQMDAEFVVKRLLDRLDAEKNDFYQPTAYYLEKMGINPQCVKWLLESESDNPKARKFLATALGIELRT